jgi:alginate O-acetyltransferase complex protein AlgI
MVFNSVGFFIFLGIVLLADRLPLGWPQRKFNLLLASLIFYASWYPPAVLLLVATLSIGYFTALAISRAERIARKKTYLIVCLVAIFGELAVFKYAGFFWDNFAALALTMRWDVTDLRPNILLPLGISFYTFQVASYVIDVYRGHMQPARSYRDFALCASFFPHLVAGPIVRFSDVYPQFNDPKRVSADELSQGIVLVIGGLFLKVTLGDAIFAPVVDAVYGASQLGSGSGLDALSAWSGILAFAGQLYCDFAGYSICAVGLARCFGFRFPWNFRAPYGSTSFTEFWTRWHISLSTWIRDYVYRPLGGNRRGPVRTGFNLMVAFVLSGFWHGASWTFVIWGAMHGLIVVIEKSLRASRASRLIANVPALLMAAAVTIVWALTLVFFRSANVNDAVYLLGRAFSASAAANVPRLLPVVFPWQIQLSFAVMAAIVLFHFLARRKGSVALLESLSAPARSCTVASLLVVMFITLPEKGHVFIYFQF